MIYYAIRHKSFQKLMPEVKTRGGYSHWNPDNPEMPNHIFNNHPRLFETKNRASSSITQWFIHQNGRRYYRQSGQYGEDSEEEIKTKSDGRTKEDLEVVEVELVIK